VTESGAGIAPAGFEPLRTSPFSELVGPLYVNASGPAPVVGVEVLPQHANAGGRAHGGLLMTLADIALSRAVRARLPPGAGIATADLHVAFLDGVPPGAWLEAHPSVDRAGRWVIHASCVVLADQKPVAKALATFAVRPPGPR
jgi:acyl-coenzyme A thioesterase 13